MCSTIGWSHKSTNDCILFKWFEQSFCNSNVYFLLNFSIHLFFVFVGAVSYFLIDKQVSTFKDNEVFFIAETRSFASDWLICGQNIGSRADGPIKTSGLLLIVSFLLTMKRVLWLDSSLWTLYYILWNIEEVLLLDFFTFQLNSVFQV